MFGVFLLIASGFLWYPWYVRAANTYTPVSVSYTRSVVSILPIACLAIFVGTFLLYADPSETDDLDYALGFIALFAVSLHVSCVAMGILGIQPLPDALERHNSAVLPCLGGSLLGTTILNIGSNLGGGDEIETTIVPLLISFLLWFAFGILLAGSTNLIDATTVNRNKQAGWCFGLAWFSASIPLARASAGNWISYNATLVDFAGVLPALLAIWTATKLLTPARLEEYTPVKTTVLIVICSLIVSVSLFSPLASTW